MREVISKSFKISTSRFVLRSPSTDDIPHIFSATKYHGFNDGMLWNPPSNQSELALPLENALKSWESGEGYSFTITNKKNDILLGRISIRKTKTKNIWDVGFWTHPESQRNGLMTEALGGILNFAFTKLSATKVEACHAVWNKASGKVLTNNGMTFDLNIEKGFKKNGEWVAENCLSISLDYWKSGFKITL